MWKSKKNIVLAAILAIVVLLGATAGVVVAQNGNSGKADPSKALFARVAQILGIDQQKLADAFKQARDEFIAKNPRPQRPEIQNQDEWLTKLVKDGKLTQAQADQLKAWWAAKPANLKENAQQFKDWLKARPAVPLPKPEWRGFHTGKDAPAPKATT